jgi:hypothetical protein
VGAAAPTPEAEQELLEVVPAARVQRSRLALAMAVTVAALPILVLDNFPATADTAGADDSVVVITTGEPSTSTTELVTSAPSTEAPTSTEAAPVVTAAPTSTTVAPTTTTTAAPVRSLVAARPTTTTTAAPPTTEPAPYGDPNDPATWDRLAQCEANGNWAANTGNGYYGGLQFSLSTWQHYGGSGYPHEASRETQIQVGQRLQAAKGWGAWPGCASKLGYS